MRALSLKEELHAALSLAVDGSSRKAILDRLRLMIEALCALEDGTETPSATRSKIATFLDELDRAYGRHGARLFQCAFLLNCVGEAMARADLVNRNIVEFVQVGLYFYGLEQIERRWASRAVVYAAVHADHLSEYVGRDSLKQLLRDGRSRFEQGRVFCLTYHYLNSLRKAYWSYCRQSEDVLDIAMTTESVGTASPKEPAAPSPEDAVPPPSDRLALLMDIFRRTLTPTQQWLYLAKNRSALSGDEVPPGTSPTAGVLGPLLSEFAGEIPAGADLGWSTIAQRLGMNEKTAKREYLRTLHIMLGECARAVFGDERIPSNYVRRVLELIRSVVAEKDLRLRSTTGRGLSTLVEKWEVALRFVLSHSRVAA